MNSFIATSLLLVSLSIFASELPSDHFLFPRDREVMWISGIETPLTARGVARHYEECQHKASFNSCDWFERFEDFSAQNLSNYPFTDEAQVTFFGERHIDEMIQNSMAQILSKQINLDVLALEMFNVSDQWALDRFSNNQMSIEELTDILEKNWRYPSAGYVKMLMAAKKLGVYFLAIDDRKKFESEVFSENLRLRDIHMSKVIESYLLKNPNDKMFIYSRKMHSFSKLSTKDSILSVVDHLKKSLSEITYANYFFYGKNENALVLHTMRNLTQNKSQIVVHTKALTPYIDGAIFLSL